MADRISDNIIDDILNETKAYIGEDTPEKIYSMGDIDRLLAEIGDEAVSKKTDVPEVKPKTSNHFVKLDKKKDIKKTFSFDISRIKELDEAEEAKAEPESEQEITVTVEDDGQMGLVPEEKTASEETVLIDLPEEKELEHVTGQISIEKTRMFNEVDIRGAYNPNISHNLGNKVARTTLGDAQPLSSPVMQEEKYRKHFMNKPVQKIEDTQEQRAIRNAGPQKTIETPGVVLKNNQHIEDVDGIRPVPTVVPAEYELQQEKTKSGFAYVHEDEIPDNQIKFDGFDDEEDILQQSEEQAEAE